MHFKIFLCEIYYGKMIYKSLGCLYKNKELITPLGTILEFGCVTDSVTAELQSTL